METLPDIPEAIRRISEAYADALSAVTKALESFPKQSGEAQLRLAEEWLRVARMGKGGLVTALNQGFELWERERRRLLGAPAAEPPADLMEVWAENWKKGLDAFTAACKVGEAWSEEARRQAELVQQTLQEGLYAWQRLWQPPDRKP